MPAETFSKPLEEILDGNCSYEYYNSLRLTTSKDKKTRICHVKLKDQGPYNSDVVLMVFTIRNQSGRWKIHSEGSKRLGTGDTVILRNNAIKYATSNNWKYVSVALAGSETDRADIVYEYIIAIESYTYGSETVYDLTSDLDELANFGHPDFYRKNIEISKKEYSIVFIKKNYFLKYLELFDNRIFKDCKDYNSNQGIVYSKPYNLLLYGLPGSGKSYTIEHDYCDEDTITERLVFHPDYTYSDFVGQILPTVDDKGQVRYEFSPGPFTRILKEAVNNNEQSYILIIEEINRGNAPAIFGEIFQLLDRKTEEDDSGILVGASEYGIKNADIAKIVYDDPNHEVRIPSNLSIIGTMNTSDQNVFTLDTAFQRRWEMRLVENSFDNVDPSLAEAEILDTGVTWRTFNTIINDKISESGSQLSSSEDKRLGVYFVKREDMLMDSELRELLENNNSNEEKDDMASDGNISSKIKQPQITSGLRQHSKFAEKVIKYLWDDAFKFNREELFNTTDYKNLEDVVNSFMTLVGSDRFKIFNDEIYGNLISR